MHSSRTSSLDHQWSLPVLVALAAMATVMIALLSPLPSPALADNQHSGTIAKKLVKQGADDEALIRISREPLINRWTDGGADGPAEQTAATMRWSPDSKRAAWMHLVLPASTARDKSAQQEIWTATVQPAGRHPCILLASDKITAAIQQSGPAIRRLPDDNGEQSNPYRLQDFAWSREASDQASGKASLLLIGIRSLTWYELASGHTKTLVSGDQPLSDVAVAPDGRSVTFLRDHKLWIVDNAGNAARVFNAPTHEDVLEGELDWPYHNEFHLERAYWWSPDPTQIAYLQIDDRKVDRYTMRSSDGSAREIVYPKPGGELPIVNVMVKRTNGGAPVEMQLGDTKNFYIPRVSWLPDGHHLAIERLDRRQHTLELILADTQTGKTTTLITETDQYWINLADDPYFFSDSKHFLWSSERSGFRHLYLYDISGKQMAQVTHGDWEVTRINAVNEAKQLIYLTATEKSPLERHLYQIKLSAPPNSAFSPVAPSLVAPTLVAPNPVAPNLGAPNLGAPTRLTSLAGTHTSVFAPDAISFADIYSSQSVPPQVEISTIESTPAHHSDPELKPSDLQPSPTQTNQASKPIPKLQPVEFLDIKQHLGLHLNALMIKPPAFDPARKYPVIVYLAGGPGEQLVKAAWAGATGLWMQLMAQNGYIVFALDNQGTTARGHYFEEPIHLRLGGMELADQRDGVQYLGTLPYVDMNRLGVAGWGYGGFLTVHAMLDKPLPYKAGFAGAPITNWHYYDAIFGERYLDDPVAYSDGWDASLAIENAPNLKGALMLAQGTDDEFVHMENALTLQDEFLDAGKSADMLILADRGHQIEDPPARLVLFTRMTQFFLNNL